MSRDSFLMASAKLVVTVAVVGWLTGLVAGFAMGWAVAP